LNKKDIHSGQIAFPGGKVEKGESSKQAAIRETLEEIGVDLRSSNFHYLGHTPSENVYKHFRRRTLFVSVHSKSYSVFLFLGDDLSFTLNPKEVSQVFWTDFHLFTHGLLK
jgi:8-oxo-dGTP pyrophosphatase MutT (NUDIX family)